MKKATKMEQNQEKLEAINLFRNKMKRKDQPSLYYNFIRFIYGFFFLFSLAKINISASIRFFDVSGGEITERTLVILLRSN